MAKTISNVKPINSFRDFFDTGIKINKAFPRTYELINNIAYATQYLEYLSKKINNEGHSVILTHLYKTYLITGMGIIEAILLYFLKSENLQKQRDFVLVDTFSSNYKLIKGKWYKTDTVFYLRLDSPKDDEMNLDYMIRRVEKKEVLGKNQDLYKSLNYLRKLRNKVHMHLIDKHLDTDYNNFNSKQYEIMKSALLQVFSSERFPYDKGKFDILYQYLRAD
ncbi:hypothetical protein [Parapedobacter indicus]|nr:hypothetical protein [Parapedobacter indicus]